MFEHMGNFDWGDVGFGMILVGAMVLGAAWVLLRQLPFKPRNRGRRAADQSPLEILNKRYADGEIGYDEFQQKKRDLGGKAGA